MDLFTIVLMAGAVHAFIFSSHTMFSKYYCENKKKKNNRKKCFYWDCPNYNNCEYNGDELK